VMRVEEQMVWKSGGEDIIKLRSGGILTLDDDSPDYLPSKRHQGTGHQNSRHAAARRILGGLYSS
jgi:hypothetical protein